VREPSASHRTVLSNSTVAIMTAMLLDVHDGASGLMELFRGKKPAAVSSEAALPPKKRRLDSLPDSARGPQLQQPTEDRPPSTNGPVPQGVPQSLPLPSSLRMPPSTMAVDLSLVPSFGAWPFGLQNTYVSPVVFMPTITQASTPKRKKFHETGTLQYGKAPAPVGAASAVARPVAAATPLALSTKYQPDYQPQHFAQNLAQNDLLFSPRNVWQQQQTLPAPRAPAGPAVQRPRAGAYPGQSCQMAARWQTSLLMLLSRGDLAENNHRLLDPIATCDAWEVPSKVLRLPPRQVDVLHPEVRSLVLQFQRDLASAKPGAAKPHAQLHARAMQASCVLNAIGGVLAGQGRAC